MTPEREAWQRQIGCLEDIVRAERARAEQAERKAQDARLDHRCSEGVIQMVLDSIGGTVEGAPTHRINFLQRVRELVRAERERDIFAFHNAGLLRERDEARRERDSAVEVLGPCAKCPEPPWKHGEHGFRDHAYLPLDCASDRDFYEATVVALRAALEQADRTTQHQGSGPHCTCGERELHNIVSKALPLGGGDHSAPYRAVVEALLGVQRGSNCWCETGIGNPMMHGAHSQACLAARAALAAIRARGDNAQPRL